TSRGIGSRGGKVRKWLTPLDYTSSGGRACVSGCLRGFAGFTRRSPNGFLANPPQRSSPTTHATHGKPSRNDRLLHINDLRLLNTLTHFHKEPSANDIQKHHTEHRS